MKGTTMFKQKIENEIKNPIEENVEAHSIPVADLQNKIRVLESSGEDATEYKKMLMSKSING